MFHKTGADLAWRGLTGARFVGNNAGLRRALTAGTILAGGLLALTAQAQAETTINVTAPSDVGVSDVSGTDDLTITTTAPVTSTGDAAITALRTGAGSVTVDVGAAASGLAYGVSAQTEFGAVTVRGSGAITSVTGYGIYASTGSGAVTVSGSGSTEGADWGIAAEILIENATADILIDRSGAVTSVRDGIAAINKGSGKITITGVGPVDSGATGISTQSARGATTIDTRGAITAQGDGINAVGYGAGPIAITANADITAQRDGIFAYNAGAGAVAITADANITAQRYGIYAQSDGGGAVAITASGSITSSTGIYAQSTGEGAVAITANANITAQDYGIYASSTGAGGIAITGSGDVSGTTSAAIYAESGSGGIEISGSGKSIGTTASGYGVITAYLYGSGDIVINRTGAVTLTGSGRAFAIDAEATGGGNVTISGLGEISSTAGGINGFANSGSLSINVTSRITAAYQAIYAQTQGVGDVTITTRSGASISVTEAGATAITATSIGKISITLEDTVTSASGAGVHAQSASGKVSVIANADVTGAEIAIFAASGTGDVVVDGSGKALGGIYASSNHGSVTVSGTGGAEVSESNSAAAAILASITNVGATSDITINRSGAINSASNYAVNAQNSGSGDVVISGLGAITAARGGVYATAQSGNVSISLTNDISAASLAIKAQTGVGSITIGGAGAINGGLSATAATGAITLSGTGALSGAAVLQITNSAATANITVNRSGAFTVNGAAAISALNQGSGSILISGLGPVNSTGTSSAKATISAKAKGGSINIGGSSGLNQTVRAEQDAAIAANATGAGAISVKTAAGGALTSSGSFGLFTTAANGQTNIDLGANVSGAGGVAATSNGAITVKTANGVSVTGTTGSGVYAVGSEVDIDLGGAVSGNISGVNAEASSGSLTITAAGNVTGATAILAKQDVASDSSSTTIWIKKGAKVTGSDKAIEATAPSGVILVVNEGAIKGSISGIKSGSGASTFHIENTGTISLGTGQAVTGFTLYNNVGGVLTGTGNFGTVNATAGSTIRPGDRLANAATMGTLSATNLYLTAGAVIDLRADVSGASDKIAVSGNALIQNATLKITATPKTDAAWASGKSYTILTAGSVGGTFATTQLDYAFLKAQLSYTGTDVTLSLQRNAVSFSSVATNAAQTSVGGALDGYSSQTTNSLIQKVAVLTDTAAAPALQQLSGAGLASTQSQAIGAGSLLTNTISTEISGQTGAASPSGALSYVDDARIKTTAFKTIAPKVEPIADGRVWAQILGGVGNLKADSTTGAPAERAFNYGVAAGADTAIDESLRLGFALSGGQSSLRISSAATKSDVTWGQAALYASATDGALYAKSILSVGYLTTKTERDVTAFGTLEKVSGEFDSLLYSARVEIGRRFEAKPVGVTPFLAFEPSLVAQNAYNEKAATPIALGFNKSTSNALPGTLGVKVDAHMDIGDVRLTPSATLGWVHNFAKATSISPFFTALPGSTFTVAGAEGDRNLARTELNLDAMQIDSAVSFHANARADIGQRTNSLRGTASVLMRF